MRLEQENRRLKGELARMLKQREDEALKGMAKLRYKGKVKDHLLKKITDDIGISHTYLPKESPTEEQIKDVENNKERKNPAAKKEAIPGKFFAVFFLKLNFYQILQRRWILLLIRSKKRTQLTQIC